MKMNLGYRAVVVEDDTDLQFLYKMKLEQQGFQVGVAADGQAGLDLIERLQPHILLLDIMMPVMDGVAMLTAVRAQSWGRDVRVIILTNISKDEAPQALRFLRVDRYIVKAHHTPAQVVGIVMEILQQKIL